MPDELMQELNYSLPLISYFDILLIVYLNYWIIKDSPGLNVFEFLFKL